MRGFDVDFVVTDDVSTSGLFVVVKFPTENRLVPAEVDDCRVPFVGLRGRVTRRAYLRPAPIVGWIFGETMMGEWFAVSVKDSD